MKSKHYLSLLIALVLLAGIYTLANTTPPKPHAEPEPGQPPMAGAAAMGQPRPEVAFDSLLQVAKKAMPQHALGEIQAVDKQLAVLRDSAQMIPLFTQYGQIWQEHKQPQVAAFYYSLAAKLEKSEKKLNFAAQLFLELARKEHTATVQNWEASRAMECFEMGLQVNPDNDTARLGLAECYFGTGEAMKGVAVLKEITKKDPEHLAANLMLGQQGLVSGQYEKAQQRFEIVLKKDPKSMEGMLGLAEAYKGTGDKAKAVALLEQCKKMINNPEFAKDIDAYIKTFK